MIADLSPALKNRLVERAEGIAEEAAKVGPEGGQASQLRNLLQIVQVESEIAVLRNFIRYQVGRKGSRQLTDFWNAIHKDLIQVLETEIGKHPDLQDPAGRRLALQRFVGYLIRHYVYRTRRRGGGRTGGQQRPPRKATGGGR